ncbi:MAG: tRNA (adenosine(37)-N6)-threonylcarbamoyltransferase complex dimerization subunit type 1 TsaB [Pseudomonadota bacterium]|nr:tRNA (adenosine(37)-N6)-threonylcarbamoyltransferase complex dimerization subunit type 1 TsaB [Pseudomonadota bacterium]
MTILLAIETSTSACSVALLHNNDVQVRHEIVARQHAKCVLPWVDALLVDAGLSLAQLDAIAVGRGPGGFTGVRIGIGIVQGLAFGVDIPVIPVSSLQVLAQTVARTHAVKQVLIAVDAKMREVYWAAYVESAEGLMQPEIVDVICLPENVEIPANEAMWTPVGDAWHVYQSILQSQAQGVNLTALSEALPHAQDLLTIAVDHYRKGEMVAAEVALPIYLRGKEAWRKS